MWIDDHAHLDSIIRQIGKDYVHQSFVFFFDNCDKLVNNPKEDFIKFLDFIFSDAPNTKILMTCRNVN